MLPSFFLIGAAKAGTTSLYHYLGQHPEVFMCPIKEPNYFAHNEILSQGLYYGESCVTSRSEYEALFAGVTDETAVGEASVSYLAYPETAGRIRELLPDAKIVVILRDPVVRAWSHYLMDARLGIVDMTFCDIVFRRGDSDKLELCYQQYVELGMYWRHVSRYVSAFGANAVAVFFSEDLSAKPEELLETVCACIGTNPCWLPSDLRRRNVYRVPRHPGIGRLYASSRLRQVAKWMIPGSLARQVKALGLRAAESPTIPAQVASHLRQLYRSDVLCLQRFCGRDLSHWLEKT